MKWSLPHTLPLVGLAAGILACPASALEIKVSAKALERTLQKQLFTDGGRYYIKGKATDACFVYAEDPRVSFAEDRVVVHVKTKARLGTSLHGACLGVGLSPEADVSVVPNAEGEIMGFRDARVDHLTESKELNFFLIPFLSHKLPQQMKVNVAELLRQLLTASGQTTGYDLKLDELKIHSMQVQGDALVVDFDGKLNVH
jgi:hypothetical protein